MCKTVFFGILVVLSVVIIAGCLTNETQKRVPVWYNIKDQSFVHGRLTSAMMPASPDVVYLGVYESAAKCREALGDDYKAFTWYPNNDSEYAKKCYGLLNKPIQSEPGAVSGIRSEQPGVETFDGKLAMRGGGQMAGARDVGKGTVWSGYMKP